MGFFPSLPAEAGVRHVLDLNPAAGRALLALHTAVLRADTALTPAHRELIVAYVSGLNGCHYCHGVHAETARALGITAGVVEALLENIDTAPVEPKLRPILHYARKLTLTPTRMVAADAQAVFAAGWTERDLHDAILAACLFNFMNRLIEGHGVDAPATLLAQRGQALAAHGYDPLAQLLRPDA